MFRKLKNLFKKKQEQGTYIKYQVNKSGDILIDISFQNEAESIDDFCSLLSAVNTLYLHDETINVIEKSVVPSLGEEVFNQMMLVTAERSKRILSFEEDEYIKPSDMITGE
jgi:hypothetical protein